MPPASARCDGEARLRSTSLRCKRAAFAYGPSPQKRSQSLMSRKRFADRSALDERTTYRFSILASRQTRCLSAMYVEKFGLSVSQWKVLPILDRKSTRLNSSHLGISYAVFCLK